MQNYIFIMGLVFIISTLLIWSFKNLPGERWQFLAALPIYKKKNGQWRSINLTYYGVFVATGQLFAITLLVCLLGSLHIHLGLASITVILLLMFCLPASRIVAMIVERKRHTFTIGGASFVGIILAPWTIYIVHDFFNIGQHSLYNFPVLPTLAALSIAYTLGEGLGRLACISYGCCYGKPINQAQPIMQKIFSRACFVFYGQHKKATYEGHLDGEPLIPIQAITSIIYCLAAIIGSLCFLNGMFKESLLLTIFVTQIWRIVSETMRADFRGFQHVSAYQKMGIIAVLYMSLVCYFLPTVSVGTPDISMGISALWQVEIILSMQVLWIVFFIFFGKSSITTSTLDFRLIKKNI